MYQLEQGQFIQKCNKIDFIQWACLSEPELISPQLLESRHSLWGVLVINLCRISIIRRQSHTRPYQACITIYTDLLSRQIDNLLINIIMTRPKGLNLLQIWPYNPDKTLAICAEKPLSIPTKLLHVLFVPKPRFHLAMRQLARQGKVDAEDTYIQAML